MINGKHLTLGIETSCDETAVSVVADGREVLSNIISTQISIHTQFGGVVPEIASRRHLENINDVLERALDEAGVSIGDIDLVGVTYGPGLVGALLIGVAAAKSISYACDIPLVGVNHMHGHIAANYLEHPNLKPPFMSLVVSGGHTNIVNVPDYNKCEKIGGTRDDAAGEAFDKVARVIGLGYPGGPKVDRAAGEGNRDAIDFKRVWLEPGSYDFSFSGLKTQALNYLNTERQAGREINVNDVAASFQEAVVEAADVEIISEDIPGWLVSNEGNLTVALEVQLSDELLKEGMARELINRIQNIRKDSGFEITDRIQVIISPNEQTDAAIADYADYIKTQVLADTIEVSYNDGQEIDFDDFNLNIKVVKS